MALPREIVEIIISYAHCDKFVVLDTSPTYTWRLVEHPWGGRGMGWYWIYFEWVTFPLGERRWCWDYKDYNNYLTAFGYGTEEEVLQNF